MAMSGGNEPLVWQEMVFSRSVGAELGKLMGKGLSLFFGKGKQASTRFALTKRGQGLFYYCRVGSTRAQWRYPEAAPAAWLTPSTPTCDL